ncbi:MAG: hypothetical protein ACKN89_12935, partial [Cyanobium sp.]
MDRRRYDHLDEIIRDEEKTHTSQQLAGKLSNNRKVTLSASYLRKLLKKGDPLEAHTPKPPTQARLS